MCCLLVHVMELWPHNLMSISTALLLAIMRGDTVPGRRTFPRYQRVKQCTRRLPRGNPPRIIVALRDRVVLPL